MARRRTTPKGPKFVTVSIAVLDHDSSTLCGEAPWVANPDASTAECREFLQRLRELVRVARALDHLVVIVPNAEDDSNLDCTLLPTVITTPAVERSCV